MLHSAHTRLAMDYSNHGLQYTQNLYLLSNMSNIPSHNQHNLFET